MQIHRLRSGAARAGLLLHLAAAGVAFAEPPPTAVSGYAATLVRLRGEVEQLSSDLDLKKEALRSRLRAVETQQLDLEAQLGRETLRLEQTRLAMARKREEIDRSGAAAAALKPAVLTSIQTLRQVVSEGLPFHQEERLQALDALEAQLQDGSRAAPETASRLWQFAEDELRLTRENAVDRGIVQIEGSERPLELEVARLGMVALYFRTCDGRVGRAVRTKAGWVFRPYDDDSARTQVANLIEALRKQVRTGFFEVPNALSEVSP